MAEIILIGLVGAVFVLLLVLIVKSRTKTDDFSRLRQEITGQFQVMSNMVMDTVDRAVAGNTAGVDMLRRAVEGKLQDIQIAVGRQLDETLKVGLDSSFRRVGEQLQQVYRGIGEMRTLTADVGDLKSILTNVKTRGIWGEIQLHKLLGDFMAPGQYEENVKIGNNFVEFAVNIPQEDEKSMLLPIDSKFPMDRYAKVLKLAEKGASADLKSAQKELAAAIIAEAKKIRDKYISPPITTDFAIMFLPSEGLYAEVIRLELLEQLQTKWRVVVAGPSTLCALLQSFQLGFKSVAIKKYSSEILDLLRIIRVEFEGVEAEIQKTQKSLAAAQGHLESVNKKSGRIQNRLTDVDSIR